MGDIVHNVEFKMGELPNDMKMSAFLAGELSNASFYFSTFANVCQKDANDFNKQIGVGKNDWRIWDYGKRVQDVEKVLKKTEELSKKSSSNPKTQ